MGGYMKAYDNYKKTNGGDRDAAFLKDFGFCIEHIAAIYDIYERKGEFCSYYVNEKIKLMKDVLDGIAAYLDDKERKKDDA